jgi:hypothetical protein
LVTGYSVFQKQDVWKYDWEGIQSKAPWWKWAWFLKVTMLRKALIN